MLKTLSGIVLLLAVFSAQGQDRCGTVQLIQQYRMQHPDWHEAYAADSLLLAQAPAANSSQRQVITIPVVVHVIYKAPDENISDAQVQSQMDALNRDYRAQNSDTANVPQIFKALRADCRIEFCLARQDPAGQPTNGIDRFLTALDSFTIGTDMKTAPYGVPGWDNTRYLNIWVCHLSHGLLGFSSCPPNFIPATQDGCVIRYTAFGTNGTATYPFNMGRTATHEVGHWLGLLHTWGDDGGACSGSDLIDDTPNQADANFGCPTYPHPTCSNSSDMFMDYMDYVDDRCMLLFTYGQNGRMDYVLYQLRPGILSSNACEVPAGFASNELAVLLSISPNPTAGNILISTGSVLNKNIVVTCTNQNGQRVMEQTFFFGQQDHYALDMHLLPNGIYMLQLSDGQHTLPGK